LDWIFLEARLSPCGERRAIATHGKNKSKEELLKGRERFLQLLCPEYDCTSFIHREEYGEVLLHKRRLLLAMESLLKTPVDDFVQNILKSHRQF
jgi:hypothetical protein